MSQLHKGVICSVLLLITTVMLQLSIVTLHYMDGHFNLHFMPTRLIFDEYIYSVPASPPRLASAVARRLCAAAVVGLVVVY